MQFDDFFSDKEKEKLTRLNRKFGALEYIHPTRAVLLRPESSARLVDETRAAFDSVWHERPQWLKAKKSDLLSADLTSACGALAEMRAYAALLDAGFSVTPIMKDGPDFIIDHSTTVEVNARQEAADILGPSGIAPFGAPDPNKPNDTVGSNVISKICGIKGTEHQFSDAGPNILWVDFKYLGLWPGVFPMSQAVPLATWNDSLWSGGIWHALYGWNGCPMFEGDDVGFPGSRMQHDGRYRQSTRLSATIIVTADHSAIFENPKPKYELNHFSRRRFLDQLTSFSLQHSIANWSDGCVAELVNSQSRVIASMDSDPISAAPQF